MEGANLVHVKRTWHTVLNEAVDHLWDLHSQTPPSAWRPVAKNPKRPSAADTSETNITTEVEGDNASLRRPDEVMVLRRGLGGIDVYRVEHEVASIDLAQLHTVLRTPELLHRWLPFVEGSDMIELLGPTTSIIKTRFRLGWPASPRDAILLTHAMESSDTVVYIATSVPWSRDAPSYLRPAPPYVRTHVGLFAVVAQYDGSKVLLTTYWSWNPKVSWLATRGGGIQASLAVSLQNIATFVSEHGSVIAAPAAFGPSLEFAPAQFNEARDTLRMQYVVLLEDDTDPEEHTEGAISFGPLSGAEPRCLEVRLPQQHGWDVSLRTKTASKNAAQWECDLRRGPQGYSTLHIQHDTVATTESFVRVTLSVQRVEASAQVRINGDPVEAVTDAFLPLPWIPWPLAMPEKVPDASLSPSLRTSESCISVSSVAGTQTTLTTSPQAAAALVRRNYIYFASLLQEPEAKWVRILDTRGVTVTQLTSIDPTLVVYRAEATFVGMSVWDMYSVLADPGLKSQWVSGSSAKLLADMGGQSALWHVRTNATWPVSPRDAILVQSSYKSPTSIHLVSFSADGCDLFPTVPAADSSTIRAQVDLHGWALEALSPNTVHVTLVEQSDPKGWSKKSVLPPQMVTAVAGAGEYVLRNGSPPTLTRIHGASITSEEYDHDKAAFRLTYAANANVAYSPPAVPECEIRCDVELWSKNLDIIVQPPPSSVSCLRRHRLAPGAGGLWLTIEHTPNCESVSVIVRRGPSHSTEHGVVLLNGTRIKVDSDELNERQVYELATRKRTKPQRIPLDFFPQSPNPVESTAVPSLPQLSQSEPPQSEPPQPEPPQPEPPGPPVYMPPMQPVLNALFLLRRIYSERPPEPAGAPAGWTLVSERSGLFVRRRTMETFAPGMSVLRADKVVPGVTADELFAVLAAPGCCTRWDERVEKTTLLESYGSGISTSFVTTRPSFPFSGRGFLVGSMAAHGMRTDEGSELMSPGMVRHPVYFYVTASFVDEQSRFDMQRLNPDALPIGRVFVDGWILEPVDPYSSGSYPIPSTRVTHVVAIDYGGAIPKVVNHLWNSSLPLAVLSLENFLKNEGPLPVTLTPPQWAEVLGDGRDDDNTLIWCLNRPFRPCTLLHSDFRADRRVMRTLSLIGRMRGRPLEAPRRHTSRPSLGSDVQNDVVICEVQVELLQYPDGYAIDVTWDNAEDAGALATQPDTYDLAQRPKMLPSENMPLRVHVYDLPPSALLAATRDVSERSHKHLVRVVLPSSVEDAPKWRAMLAQRGAAVLVSISPPNAPVAPHAAPLGGQVPVTCNGKVAEIVYGEEAQRVLSSREDEQTAVDQLQRVPHSQIFQEESPQNGAILHGVDVYAEPLAVSSIATPPVADTKPLTPAQVMSETKANEPAKPEEPPAPSPLFGILGRGSRAPAGSSVLSSTLASVGIGVQNTAEEPETQLERTRKRPAATVKAEHELQDVSEPPAPTMRSCRGRPQFRLSTLVLTAIVAFLLGSLMQSLLMPADFVLLPAPDNTCTPQQSSTAPPRPNTDMSFPSITLDGRAMFDAAAREVENFVRAARQLHFHARQADTSAEQEPHPGRATDETVVRWREIRRMIDLRIPGFQWDFVIALVRHNRRPSTPGDTRAQATPAPTT